MILCARRKAWSTATIHEAGCSKSTFLRLPPEARGTTGLGSVPQGAVNSSQNRGYRADHVTKAPQTAHVRLLGADTVDIWELSWKFTLYIKR
jgi:hypothetical protein